MAANDDEISEPGLHAMAGEKPSVICMGVDKACPKGDLTVHSIMEITPRKMKLIAVLPGDEPVCMTTWNDRVIVGQGNRLYEIKRNKDEELVLVDLEVPPFPTNK